jgi:hypothetical protein
MHNPTDQAEAFIPTRTTVIKNDPNMNLTVKECRKAKRTLPCDRTVEELDIVSPPHDEAIPARKMRRPLEKPLPTTTDKVTRAITSPDLSEEISPPAAENYVANADPVTGTQPNAGAGGWTSEEDEKLTRAVTNTSKKKQGKEYKTDSAAISALIPWRTRIQCCNRWHNGLDPSINLTAGRKGKWTVVEDSNLKDAVQTHGGKGWGAIAALVPGRAERQCWHRWHDILDPDMDRASGLRGKWTAVENRKLEDAAQTQGDRKDWVAISALVPGRTRGQCYSRWDAVLDPSIGRASGRKGK